MIIDNEYKTIEVVITAVYETDHIDTMLQEAELIGNRFSNLPNLGYFSINSEVSDEKGEKEFVQTVLVELKYDDREAAISMVRELENDAVFYNSKNYNINLIEKTN